MCKNIKTNVIVIGINGGNIFTLSRKSPSNNNLTDRWKPQPGQSIPKLDFQWHFSILGIFHSVVYQNCKVGKIKQKNRSGQS